MLGHPNWGCMVEAAEKPPKCLPPRKPVRLAHRQKDSDARTMAGRQHSALAVSKRLVKVYCDGTTDFRRLQGRFPQSAAPFPAPDDSYSTICWYEIAQFMRDDMPHTRRCPTAEITSKPSTPITGRAEQLALNGSSGQYSVHASAPVTLGSKPPFSLGYNRAVMPPFRVHCPARLGPDDQVATVGLRSTRVQ